MLVTCVLITDVLLYVWTNTVESRERFVGLPSRNSYTGLSKKFEVCSEEIEDKFISKNELILEAIIDSSVR
jgi:dimeric dUTPase (all-alpha-NTP-PPase superfamily)